MSGFRKSGHICRECIIYDLTLGFDHRHTVHILSATPVVVVKNNSGISRGLLPGILIVHNQYYILTELYTCL